MILATSRGAGYNHCNVGPSMKLCYLESFSIKPVAKNVRMVKSEIRENGKLEIGYTVKCTKLTILMPWINFLLIKAHHHVK